MKILSTKCTKVTTHVTHVRLLASLGGLIRPLGTTLPSVTACLLRQAVMEANKQVQEVTVVQPSRIRTVVGASMQRHCVLSHLSHVHNPMLHWSICRAATKCSHVHSSCIEQVGELFQ